VEPIIRQATTPSTAATRGKKTNSIRAKIRRLVSRSAVGTAATTSTSTPPAPEAAAPATVSSPVIAARLPGTVIASPASTRTRSGTEISGVSRSAEADPPSTRLS
jgi:hypothetical protein